MSSMNELLEAKASLMHSTFSRAVDDHQVVSCSDIAKKLVLAEEKARRQYIENTRKDKLKMVYRLDEEKLQSDFNVLKYIGCELFAQTVPDHMTKPEFVDFIITVYGSGRERNVTQKLFQLIDTDCFGRVSQLDVLIYCEPILTKPLLLKLANCGRQLTYEQFWNLNVTNSYK